MGAWRRIAALVLVLGAFVASGCGDDGGEDAASPPQGASSEQSTTTGEQSTIAPGQAEEDEGGGEKSIEEFGSEAEDEDRGSILAVFEGYLEAVAEDDPATACSHLSANVQQSLEQLVARSKKGLECAQILPKLLAPTAPAISREQANGEVTRVRVEGDQAFVVFRAPGAKLYTLGLVREGDEWKATTIAASVLVPQL